MSSKYTPLKFAALVTSYFIAVLIAIFLINVLNVSSSDMGILIVQGVVFGIFYLIVAYFGNNGKITSLKFVILILVATIPLAIAIQSIVHMAVQYDSILIITFVFILAITVACTYEILGMLIGFKFYKATRRNG